MTYPNSSGGIVTEQPAVGRRVERNWITNLGLFMDEPKYFKDPKTASVTITAVKVGQPLLLRVELPAAANAANVVFTAPTGTKWRIADFWSHAGTTVSSSTLLVSTTTGSVATKLTTGATGAVVRASAGWTDANAIVAAAETISVTSADGATQQAQTVYILLFRVAV